MLINPQANRGNSASLSNSPPKKAVTWFAGQVKKLRAVREVLLERTNNGFVIWTILDQEPGNRELKHHIYDLEGQMLDQVLDENVDFRLVNLAEFGKPESAHLPQQSETIYKRSK